MSQETSSTTRRDFARNALQSLTAFALVEGLWSRRLLGKDVTPIVDAWFKELIAISTDVHDHRTKDVEFQSALERLYQHVDLKALMKTLDFDRLAQGVNFPAKGAKSFALDFTQVGGLPRQLEGKLPRTALRPNRRSYRSLHHPADDRPHVSDRRILDHFRS
jgi:hypothetical protein